MKKSFIFVLLTTIVLLLSARSHASTSGDLLWQHKFDSQLWSPMNLHQGVLYFGSDKGVFYAFDSKTKKIKWSFNTGGLIRSGSSIYGNNIAFASDDGFLYALNKDTGKQQWRFNLDNPKTKRRLPAVDAPYEYDYIHSSPVYFSGIIFIGSANGKLYAIDAEQGKVHWEFSSKNKIRSSPVVQNGMVYIGSWDGHMYAIDMLNGKQQWAFNSGGIIQDTPAFGFNTLFFGSRSTNFYAVNATTGKLRWKYHHEDGSWAESSPIFDKGNVYVGSSDALSLFAFDAMSGQKKWKFKNTGWNWATPTLANKRLYIGALSASPYYFEGITLKPGFYAVDKNSGKKLWQFTPNTQSDYVTGGIFAPAIVSKGTIYVATVDGFIYAFRE